MAFSLVLRIDHCARIRRWERRVRKRDRVTVRDFQRLYVLKYEKGKETSSGGKRVSQRKREREREESLGVPPAIKGLTTRRAPSVCNYRHEAWPLRRRTIEPRAAPARVAIRSLPNSLLSALSRSPFLFLFPCSLLSDSSAIEASGSLTIERGRERGRETNISIDAFDRSW